MSLRVPRVVRLPFGYTVRVRLLTHAQMVEHGERNSDGAWDCVTRTVFIRKRLPPARQRYLLAHELGHAFLDWQIHHCNEGNMRP